MTQSAPTTIVHDPFSNIKTVHFIGVGGIGLSRLAKLFLMRGKSVSGSDLVQNDIVRDLQKAGLVFFEGHDAKNLPEKCDLAVHTIAIPENNPERAEAHRRGLRQMSHFEVIGELSSNYFTIAVAGTNGKSTTTALLGLILEAGGLDPTVMVGSKVAAWNGNIRVGKSKYLVVEADELNRQFLTLHPHAAILTNIEPEHLDYYKDLDDLKSAFEQFIKQVSEMGFVVYNDDDVISRGIIDFIHIAKKISYGKKSNASMQLVSSHVVNQKQIFEILFKKKNEIFQMPVPGEYNVYNAMAAICCADMLRIPMDKIKLALEKFTGIWRRFEIMGKLGDALVISDYAHHPTSVFGTVEAVKSFYPNKRILLVFQPHQRKRTAILKDDFIRSIVDSRPDGVVLTEIFDVAGRDEDKDLKISSLDLVEAISKQVSETYYAPTEKAEEQIRTLAPNFDVILIMGAGNVYDIAVNLIKK